MMGKSDLNGKAVMVIAEEEFRDEEYTEPKAILENAGIDVTTASIAAGPCKGKLGSSATAEIDIEEALEQDWDVTVFVGGGGAARYFENAAAHELACKAISDESVLGAICIAPTILAKAGLLKGVTVTSFSSEKDVLCGSGALWTGKEVEASHLDKNDAVIVTANGPDAASKFGKALLQAYKETL